IDGTLFFTANDGVNGAELWKSDGTTAGTVLIKDINPGRANSYPQNHTVVNGTLFFTANDGTTGVELWKSDGTAAGTVMVKDIRPGSAYGFPLSSSPRDLTAVGDELFFSANDGISGRELWKSDGTAAGTVLVKDIRPGSSPYGYPYGSNPQHLTAVDGTLFFAANDAVHGTERGKSAATAGGTVLGKDIRPGNYGSYPYSLTAVDGTLFFTANDGVNGTELWKSNGTTQGTALVLDIRPGSYGSYPDALVNVDGRL